MKGNTVRATSVVSQSDAIENLPITYAQRCRHGRQVIRGFFDSLCGSTTGTTPDLAIVELQALASTRGSGDQSWYVDDAIVHVAPVLFPVSRLDEKTKHSIVTTQPIRNVFNPRRLVEVDSPSGGKAIVDSRRQLVEE